MAGRLLDAGIEVRAWSRHNHKAATARLAKRGATAHFTAADAAREADVVITMLPTEQATAEVIFGMACVSIP